MRKVYRTLLSGYRTGTYTMPSNNPNESLKQFISVRPLFSYAQFIPNSVNPQRAPNTPYTFDSERGASQSEICRQGKNKECIIVRLSVHEKIITQPAIC
jgi:hypothetical protein